MPLDRIVNMCIYGGCFLACTGRPESTCMVDVSLYAGPAQANWGGNKCVA